MNNFSEYNGILNSLYLETALLEALEWDEIALKKVQSKLSEYFSVCSKSDLDIVRVDLGHIFSESIADIVYSYLKQCMHDIELENKEE